MLFNTSISSAIRLLYRQDNLPFNPMTLSGAVNCCALLGAEVYSLFFKLSKIVLYAPNTLTWHFADSV